MGITNNRSINQIFNIILLIINVFMGLSILFHLNVSHRQQASKMDVGDDVEVAAKRMTIGTVLVAVAGCLFIIMLILYDTVVPPNLPYCQIIYRIWLSCYSAHKIGLYMFIFYRASSFHDFLSDNGWKCVKILSACTGVLYLVFIVGVLIQPGQVFTIDSSGYCFTDVRSTFFVIFGSIQAFVDVVVGVTGIGIFLRLFFCSDVLGRLARNEPEIGRQARRVVICSSLALLSTTISIFLVFTVADFAPSLDVTVNLFLLGYQYPKSLLALIYAVFGENLFGSRSESEKMVSTEMTAGDSGKKSSSHSPQNV